jgi:hypothetical protein
MFNRKQRLCLQVLATTVITFFIARLGAMPAAAALVWALVVGLTTLMLLRQILRVDWGEDVFETAGLLPARAPATRAQDPARDSAPRSAAPVATPGERVPTGAQPRSASAAAEHRETVPAQAAGSPATTTAGLPPGDTPSAAEKAPATAKAPSSGTATTPEPAAPERGADKADSPESAAAEASRSKDGAAPDRSA